MKGPWPGCTDTRPAAESIGGWPAVDSPARAPLWETNMKTLLTSMGLTFLLATGAANASPPADAHPMPRVQVEIYRIAPGAHAEFLRLIARYDEANRIAGLPPRQLYVHQDGASWDFIIIQPADTTAEQDKKLAAAAKQLGIPAGASFFFEIRRFIAEHTDTSAIGPISAAEWLASQKP
jgi:hypothetical protein